MPSTESMREGLKKKPQMYRSNEGRNWKHSHFNGMGAESRNKGGN